LSEMAGEIVETE